MSRVKEGKFSGNWANAAEAARPWAGLRGGCRTGSGAYADRHRLPVGMFQPFEHDEGLVGTVIRAGPSVAGIEEIR